MSTKHLSGRLRAALDNTEALLQREDYRGYDPYDGLQSPLFRFPGLGRARIPCWGFQQLLRRIPFQVRPLLGIRRGLDPVTLGLAAQALAIRDSALPVVERSRRGEVERLVKRLADMRTPGYSGSCWGYAFDWESHYTRIPKGHPTVVATGFITHALARAHAVYGLPQARALILAAVPFVRKDLKRNPHKTGFCWSYSPTDTHSVLNATMKGARLLAQAVSLGGDPVWLEDATATIRYVVSKQSEDGRWPYASGDARLWADHFHTCYILDALDEYMRLTDSVEFRPALERGLAYYLDRFFTDDALPKYYDDRNYPIDATCCGQALLTLVRFSRIKLAERVATSILDHMALPGGAFKYRLHRWYENRLVYMRWSVAWIFAGLSQLEDARRTSRENQTT